MSTEMEVLFFVGGLVAGIINTLAGNGSGLTVSLLMFGGMDGAVANATNRIGVMTQTLTSVLSLRPSLRKRYLMRASRGLAIPTLLGSLAGAFLGISLPVNVIEWTLAFVMMGMGVTLFLKPERWGGPSDAKRRLTPWQAGLWFFLIGFYGGFVQMGIGVLMLIALVLGDRWSLRDANVIKLLMALILAIPAGLLYVVSDRVEWRPGLIMAFGATLGAWFGARYIVRIPKAQPYVRYLLMAVVLFGAIQAVYKAMT
ncbi:MAG TPA: hypothetical protein DCL07_01215 [Cryomorphaceae bacterium]|nr:hypothetical protein [Cryomorphaceae bacterium]